MDTGPEHADSRAGDLRSGGGRGQEARAQHRDAPLGAAGQLMMVVRTRRLELAVRLGRAAHGVCLLLQI